MEKGNKGPLFDHEKLDVYKRSLEFVGFVNPILNDIPKAINVVDQLDRASTSIPLNIAEGNGKYTPRDRCRYFNNARGSALESAGALDVFVEKNLLDKDIAFEGKKILREIVAMLVGLIKSNSDRVHEKEQPYVFEPGEGMDLLGIELDEGTTSKEE